MRKTESMGRAFLWNNSEEKEGYVSWASVTKPLSCRGLRIRDILRWNQATIL